MTPQKTVLTLTIAAIGFAALATSGSAQEPRGMMFPFAEADADKDGKLTQAELDAYRAAEAAALDSNADGKLSVEELTAAQLAKLTARATEMATRMVAAQDTDGDMALSAAEMASRPMPAMLFEKADADGDGAVTEAEIATLQAEMAEHRGGRHGKDGRGKPGEGKHGEGKHGPRFWDMMGDD